MKIIILRGPSDSGKTTTLNMFFDIFKNDPIVELAGERNFFGEPKNLDDINAIRDFESTITLKDKRVIAMYTMGDFEFKYIIRNIKHNNNLGVDILIMASNADKQKHFIYATENFEHEIVTKTVSITKDAADINQCNTADCKQIRSYI